MPTHRDAFFKKHGLPKDKSLSIEEIARVAKVPVAALREVYKRGEGAWGNNLASVRIAGTYAKNPDTKKYGRGERLSASQWAYARIYSFLNKGKTYKTADSDIARKYNI